MATRTPPLATRTTSASINLFTDQRCSREPEPQTRCTNVVCDRKNVDAINHRQRCTCGFPVSFLDEKLDVDWPASLFCSLYLPACLCVCSSIHLSLSVCLSVIFSLSLSPSLVLSFLFSTLFPVSYPRRLLSIYLYL